LLGDPDENDSIAKCSWNAERDGMAFRGNNPIELLGLIAIRDHHCPESDAPYWWRIEEPNLIAELESAWRKTISSD
jgi:hypothetical protein